MPSITEIVDKLSPEELKNLVQALIDNKNSELTGLQEQVDKQQEVILELITKVSELIDKIQKLEPQVTVRPVLEPFNPRDAWKTEKWGGYRKYNAPNYPSQTKIERLG